MSSFQEIIDTVKIELDKADSYSKLSLIQLFFDIIEDMLDR